MRKTGDTTAFQLIEFPPSAAILALGGEKGRFCLARGGEAFLSADFGSLEETRNFVRYRKSLFAIVRSLAFRPEIIAHDLHPDYLATRFARKLALSRFPSAALTGVQHHHAHIAAVLAERGERRPVVGLAWDGTGYGEDGTVWGGETLIVDRGGYRRVGGLAAVPMPGGEKAVEEPWRMAVSYLYRAFGGEFLDLDIPFVRRLPRRSSSLLLSALEKGINAPRCSSMGRLFDAVAALLGLDGGVASGLPAGAPGAKAGEAPRQTDGGAAAPALEKSSAPGEYQAYPFTLACRRVPFTVDCRPLFQAIVGDLRRGVSRPVVAARFHRTVIEIGAASVAAGKGGLRRVALAGGVFQNRIVREGLCQRLRGKGFEVMLPEAIPVHDGGIAVGQAWVACQKSETRLSKSETKDQRLRCVSPSP
jgi:hydrogenase maturation protein HypF